MQCSLCLATTHMMHRIHVCTNRWSFNTGSNFKGMQNEYSLGPELTGLTSDKTDGLIRQVVSYDRWSLNTVTKHSYAAHAHVEQITLTGRRVVVTDRRPLLAAVLGDDNEK